MSILDLVDIVFAARLASFFFLPASCGSSIMAVITQRCVVNLDTIGIEKKTDEMFIAVLVFERQIYWRPRRV